MSFRVVAELDRFTGSQRSQPVLHVERREVDPHVTIDVGGGDRAPPLVGAEELDGPDRGGRPARGGVGAGGGLPLAVACDDERADQDREYHDESGTDSQGCAAPPLGSRGLLRHTYQEATTSPPCHLRFFATEALKVGGWG